MNMFVGRTETIEVNMPAVVKEAGPAISFRSSQPDIASVDEDGNVTALSVGDAKITASVTLGNTTKTAETDIAVEGSLDGSSWPPTPLKEMWIASKEEIPQRQ